MSITAINSTATDLSAYQVEGSGSTSIGMEDFLELFLVQLENQDPLDPVDANTLTQQLCNMSQLEQAVMTNDYLEELVSYEASNSNSQAMDYIGKSVDIEGNTLSVSEGNSDDLSFELTDDAGQIYITVYDQDGNVVRTEELSDLSSGFHSLSWDGIDDDGDTLADGEYGFEVTAYDADGEEVEVTTYTTSEVTGVVFRDGESYLVADGEEISLDNVAGVHQS